MLGSEANLVETESCKVMVCGGRDGIMVGLVGLGYQAGDATDIRGQSQSLISYLAEYKYVVLSRCLFLLPR